MPDPTAETQDAPGHGNRNARVAAVAMLVGFGLFAVFYSEGATHFARNLPGNAATDLVVDGADAWHGLMQHLGPARLAPAVRDALETLRHLAW